MNKLRGLWEFLKLMPGIVGLSFFTYCVVTFLARYGTHWEFGKFGMPRSLVAEDGVHYLDGDEIDLFTLAMIRSGREEGAFLVYLGILAVVIVGLVIATRSRRRT